MPYPLYYVSCFPLALDYSLVFINYYLFSLFHITLSLYYITLNRMSCSLVFPLSFPFILYPFIYNNPTGNRYLVTFFPFVTHHPCILCGHLLFHILDHPPIPCHPIFFIFYCPTFIHHITPSSLPFIMYSLYPMPPLSLYHLLPLYHVIPFLLPIIFPYYAISSLFSIPCHSC